MSTECKPAGKKGAPVVILSKRPQREAAKKAPAAWESLRSISLSPKCKHPWLQEDQPDEDDEDGKTNDPYSRSQVDPYGQNGDEDEKFA